MQRIILHSDLNNFFASVECFLDPTLAGKPVAVAGDEAERHGIVLAKNCEAKKYGVRTGHTLGEARSLCPSIIFVPPHYELYEDFSRRARQIYKSYSDLVEPFGIDECWIDISLLTQDFKTAEAIAYEIKEKIKAMLGITVSIGVSFNKIFAKLGSDIKKPDAVTVISPGNYREKVWTLPVEDLLFVGRSTQKKFFTLGIKTIGDLAEYSPELLEYSLGKNGIMLHRYANGLDLSPVSSVSQKTIIKSVSNSTTPPRDIVTENDARITLYALCENISMRMRRYGLVCDTVKLGIRDTALRCAERQTKLEYPNRTAAALFDGAYSLLKANRFNEIPLRSIGVSACGISEDRYEQLSFAPYFLKIQRREALESTTDSIRTLYGTHSIQRGVMFTANDLAINFAVNRSSFGSDARLNV